MQPSPVLLRIGPFPAYWFLALIVIGALLIYYMAKALVALKVPGRDIAWQLAVVCVVSAIVGACAYRLLTNLGNLGSRIVELLVYVIVGVGGLMLVSRLIERLGAKAEKDSDLPSNLWLTAAALALIGARIAVVAGEWGYYSAHIGEIFGPEKTISVYWYGVLIVSGSMLAAYIVSKLSSRNGHNPEIAWNLLLVCLAAGVIGARLYHIISNNNWAYYRNHLGEIFGLQMTGFGIYGAVIGGAIGLWIFAHFSKLRFLEWADYCAPGLILAQAIGRWGNFFNQELYGPPTNLPWGIYIPPENRLPGLENFSHFHPVFFYESMLNFAGFLVLLYLARNWRKNRLYGDIFFLYCIIYPAIRFPIEFLRPDAWKLGGVATAQWISIAAVIVFGALLFYRHKVRKPSMIYAPGTPWQPPVTKETAGGTEAEPDKGPEGKEKG